MTIDIDRQLKLWAKYEEFKEKFHVIQETKNKIAKLNEYLLMMMIKNKYNENVFNYLHNEIDTHLEIVHKYDWIISAFKRELNISE